MKFLASTRTIIDRGAAHRYAIVAHVIGCVEIDHQRRREWIEAT